MNSEIHSKAPEIKDIKEIFMPDIKVVSLPNGVPLTIIQGGSQEVMKLEFIFNAGRITEDKKLVAKSTATLMKEGAGELSGYAIAEQLDYYGATLRIRANMDSISISFYSMSKHFKSLLPVLEQVFFEPHFKEKDLNQYKIRNIQRLKEDLSKNEIVAYRSITEQIFTKDHPYGYNSSEKDYSLLEIEDLKNHYSKFINSNGFEIILSGKTDDTVVNQIRQSFGQHKILSNSQEPFKKPALYKPSNIQIPSVQDRQNAICVGLRLFNRTHPSYGGLYVLNTILGGYFGSRLMANLREKNGFTYNVYSMLDVMKHDG
ncbi:MAG: pitrilysin family protein, partial [Bacteroidota bacterium]